MDGSNPSVLRAPGLPSTPAVIGPNAVLQLEEALREAGGEVLAERIFTRAGWAHLLVERPADMIDEAIPRALFATLFAELEPDQARSIAHRAGQLTGAYILANRIPAPVRILLKLLPATLAAPLLLNAIQRHAWTFAGSGVCVTQAGRPARLTLENNPLSMPGCVWHVGVFEVLFRSLVSAKTRVAHPSCQYTDGPTCAFEVGV